MLRSWHVSWAVLIVFTGCLLLTYAPVRAHGDGPPATPEPSGAESGGTLFFPFVGQDENPARMVDKGEPPGEPVDPVDDHAAGDYYLAEQARMRNEPPYVAPRLLYSTAAVEDRSKVGQWGPVVTWPFAFATAANLPDGRILAWGGNDVRNFSGGTSTYSSIWDPATGQFLSRNHTDHSMFCAVPVMLEDGRVFVNGGDGTRERTSTFDYRTNTWTRVQDMNVGRWYPGSVALPNSEVFTALGDPGSRYSEKWTASTGWTYLTGADLQEAILNFPGQTVHWLPYLFLNSDGRIFHSGPSQQMNWITHTGNGSVASANLNNSWFPKYSTSVMYDEGKILVAGGQVSGNNMAATNQAMIINLNGATPTKTAIAPMNYARKFNNGVVLPTGEMLVIGGNTSGAEFSDDGTVLTPEIWNPHTQTWRTVAQHSVPRNYHSVALLMADGRVFSGGGGLCDCSADHPDHQVYSPPYLFNADGSLATRPAISSAPNVVSYDRTISVAATPGVQKFSLIKMSGTTHNLNSDLRYLSVPFSEVNSGQYQLRLHSNRNVMTPGYWMLFAVNSQGVPSVAKVIAVSSVDAPVVTNPGAQSSPIESAESLAIVASDPTGDPLTYSASGLPPGLTIDSNSGVIDGVLKAVGLYTATVGVFDGANTTSVKFAWSVSAASPVRYVKLEARSEVNGNPWSSGAELNLVDEYGVALRRGAWRVRTDSEETQGGSHAAANVLDGNTNTFWQTQRQGSIPAHPHWLVVDMGAATSVGGFRYLPRQDAADGRIKDYRFYVSADGVTWGSPVAQGAFANNVDEKSVAVSETWTPDISGPGAQSSMVGETIRLPIQAVDHDGDPLSYAGSGLPPGLTIDNAGVIAGTIANALNSIGAYEVTLTVRDSRGFASSVAFTWTVQAQALMLNPITSTPKPVNTPVGYTAIGNNGINPRYKWQFGDGTAETAYSSSSHASHSYSQPGIYMVRLTATDDRGVEQSITFVQAIHLPLTARRPAASTSIAYEQRTTSNSRVWVVNADNDTVAVFDAETNAKLAELPAGPAPRSVAVGPMGSAAAGRVWVSNKGTANSGASITVLDTHPLGVVGSISLPVAAQPYGLVFAPDGSAAYVALEAMGQVLKLDPGTGNMLGSVAVGPDPRHLSVSADGATLLVARFVTPPLPGEATAAVQTTPGGAKVGGEVVVVNTASMSIVKTVVLQFGDKRDSEVQGRGVPNYLGAPAISPDGSAAWVPSKQDNVQRGVLRDGNNLNFQNTVRAISSRIELVGLSEDYNSRIDHDNAGVASSAVFDPYGVYLFVTLETSREVAVVDVFGRRELFRIAVGRAPQGLAVSPDGTRLYVNNFMDRTVSVLDIAALVKQGSNGVPVVKTLAAVTSEKLGAQVLAGKQLFYDAKDPRLALDAYVSCAACHSDGGQDGRVWDMTGFGEGLRNTVSLRGRSGMGQGPLHWSANFDEVQDFEGQIRKLSGGTGLMSNADFAAAQDPQGAAKAGRSADLDALAAYVASLNSFDVSPHRSGDGALTSAGAAGKAVFQTANCANCHGGTSFTNSAPGNLPNIGTLKPSSGNRASGPLSGLDIPTLRDVWRSAPYLHDGSAQTLADAVRAHDNVAVNDSDLATLVAYLQQVDAWEPVAPASTQVTPIATPIATPLPGVTPEPVATPTPTPIISDPVDVPPVTPVPQEGSIVPGSWIKPLYLPYVVR